MALNLSVATLCSICAVILLVVPLATSGARFAPNTSSMMNVAASDEQSKFQPPWFCHGIDCPAYTVLNAKNETTAQLWEERLYPASFWTETYVSGLDYDKAMTTGFQRLFRYISGDNEKKMKVAMTAPVTSYITPGAGPFCEDFFNISFYVPNDLQGMAPMPSEQDVHSIKRDEMRVFVTAFPGFSSIEKIRAAATSLGENLVKHGEEFDTEHIYFAGYDSPFRFFNRHNEVWLIGA